MNGRWGARYPSENDRSSKVSSGLRRKKAKKRKLCSRGKECPYVNEYQHQKEYHHGEVDGVTASRSSTNASTLEKKVGNKLRSIPTKAKRGSKKEPGATNKTVKPVKATKEYFKALGKGHRLV